MSTAALTADTRVVHECRHCVGTSPSVLPEIYQDDVNLAIWHRQLGASILESAERVVQSRPNLQLSVAVTPDNAASLVRSAINSAEQCDALCEDIARLVDMFCVLFELRRVGLRLTTLDRAMCSRFHVDIVPCRLVTTYSGVATEWLGEQNLDRSKLGRGNNGKPDSESGLYSRSEDVQVLSYGDVALLKGENWEGNQGSGLVHRSPAMREGTQRLLMTLDFIDD